MLDAAPAVMQGMGQDCSAAVWPALAEDGQGQDVWRRARRWAAGVGRHNLGQVSADSCKGECEPHH